MEHINDALSYYKQGTSIRVMEVDSKAIELQIAAIFASGAQKLNKEAKPLNLNKEKNSMLVLSRKVDESILIGDDIKIVVTEIRRDKVRIGVVAPKDTKVLRKELLDQER